MINLFDHYQQYEFDMHVTLLKAGFDNLSVVIKYDGFLPADIEHNPYAFFMGDQRIATPTPRYFNQIDYPKHWRIEANNQEAVVYDYEAKRGVIHYAEPKNKRCVKTVDWLDLNGQKIVTDKYDKYGRKYGKVTYDRTGRAVSTHYYNSDGKEVIVENHITEHILLHHFGETLFFPSVEAFVAYYLQSIDADLSVIFYNNLGLPLFTSLLLERQGKDILFWQEEPRADLPGNMKVLLANNGRRTGEVIVQNKASFDAFSSTMTDEQRPHIHYMGQLFPVFRKNTYQNDVLILTNTDQVEQLDAFVKGLPQFRFHIGALTEMSSKLMSFGQYDNVNLYPNIDQSKLDDLLNRCDWYLDINHGSEIVAAVRSAFDREMIILGFNTLLHQPRYVALEHRFDIDKTGDFIAYMQALSGHKAKMDEALQQQKAFAGQDDEARVKKLLTALTKGA